MRKAIALLLFAFAAAGLAAGGDKPGAKKKLLVITESRGFVHDVVRRGKDGEPCLVEKVLTELGERSGDFEAVCTQDSRKAITAENLANFDAVFFYTTGTLPLSDTQKADFLGFVRGGRGFAGSHSATDTFYDWPEYGKLVGGYFDGHPWHEKIRVVVEDTKHPATRHLGEAFEITDEIYQFKAPYDRKDLHVLMRMDQASDRERVVLNGKELKPGAEVELSLQGEKKVAKVNGKEVRLREFRYQAPRGTRKDRDNALAWVHEYGKGRVFYTALGHRPEVWKDERFRKHMLGGLRYVLGLESADATPSAAEPGGK
jgi:type 1 glutamine amidotransferase